MERHLKLWHHFAVAIAAVGAAAIAVAVAVAIAGGPVLRNSHALLSLPKGVSMEMQAPYVYQKQVVVTVAVAVADEGEGEQQHPAGCKPWVFVGNFVRRRALYTHFAAGDDVVVDFADFVVAVEEGTARD